MTPSFTGFPVLQCKHEPESAFVESFILKPRRERALELLASSKNRHKFTSKFDHHGRDYIIPKCIRPIEPRHQHPPPIADMLRAMGAPETCHVIGGERDVYLEATRRLLAKYRHYTH